MFGAQEFNLGLRFPFANKNVGPGILVTATDSLSGSSAGNYVLVQPTGLIAAITPKSLTVDGTTVSDKVYDGSATAKLAGGILVGVIAGDTVTMVVPVKTPHAFVAVNV